MKLNRSGLILLAILLLGLFLRVYDLSKESVWLDEGYSIKVANLNLHKMLEEVSREVHPPLYYVLLHLWISLFGVSEFSVRFPSVIFGFLAIFMIYKVGSLIFDRDVGILSSLILGLSVFHIHYSQEARMYSLLSLITLLSMYFFIRLLEKRSLLASIGYILSSILLMYTHIYGFFIIAAQGIYLATVLLLSKRVYKLSLKRWILWQLILIVLFTPWIKFMIISVLGVVQNGFWIPTPSIHSIINSFLEYTGSRYLLLFFLILSIFSVVTYKRVSGSINWKDLFKSIESYQWNIGLSNTNRVYLLLLWLLIPIILPFLISKFSSPIYLTRYTIAASLAFYLLVAKGIRDINFKYIKLAVIGIIIALSLRVGWSYHNNINKEQWREVANYVDTNAENRDLLVFNSYIYLDWVFDYYSKKTDLIKKAFSSNPEYIGEENIKELVPIVEGYNKVWYILSDGVKEDHELIRKKLSESYNLLYYKKYVGIEVYQFEKK